MDNTIQEPHNLNYGVLVVLLEPNISRDIQY